jgi:hypothetical protein
MKTTIIFDKLVTRTFSLMKVNQVLSMPLLLFLLLLVIIFSPIAGVNVFILIAILALKSVFLAGWLNMFHMCLEYSNNENLTDEQKTVNSLDLYKEFFPGVGKYFQRVFWGIMILVLFINLGETLIFNFFGHFKSFNPETVPQAISSKADILNFWNKISPADKSQLYKLAAYDSILIIVISYLTMFWLPAVISEEKRPLQSYFISIKTILNDPINTFIMFVFAVIILIFIAGLNFIMPSNLIAELLVFMFSVYGTVFYTMMVFLYFERYR